MAACYMGIITLQAEPEGRPTCLGDKSHTQQADPPSWTLLEDPDKGRPVHIQACCAASFQCQAGKMCF